MAKQKSVNAVLSPVDELIKIIKDIDRELVASQVKVLDALQDNSLGNIQRDLAERFANDIDLIEFLKCDTIVKRLNFVLLSVVRNQPQPMAK